MGKKTVFNHFNDLYTFIIQENKFNIFKYKLLLKIHLKIYKKHSSKGGIRVQAIGG